MDKSIIPECFADTLLVETLVPPAKGYNHQRSCFKVESAMKHLSNKFAVGIIDKDKKQIKYLDQFDVFDSCNEDLILWRHKDKLTHHWIIQICPALERWILRICEDEKISLNEFGNIPFEGLKYYTKSSERLNNPKLKSLFKELCQRKENISIRKLKGWLTILKEKNYQVDINELKNV